MVRQRSRGRGWRTLANVCALRKLWSSTARKASAVHDCEPETPSRASTLAPPVDGTCTKIELKYER